MILTKGIIKKLNTLDSNKYEVYIPLLRKTNTSELEATFKATRIYTSGINEDLKIGDVVFISFEDFEYSKPVIVGKLFIDETEDINNNIQCNTLKVSGGVKLPANTEIGNLNLNSSILKLNSLFEDQSLNIDYVDLSSYFNLTYDELISSQYLIKNNIALNNDIFEKITKYTKIRIKANDSSINYSIFLNLDEIIESIDLKNRIYKFNLNKISDDYRRCFVYTITINSYNTSSVNGTFKKTIINM